MAITATRDGQVIRADALTQEQLEAAWAAVFRSFLQTHPELVKTTGGQDAAEPSTSSA